MPKKDQEPKPNPEIKLLEGVHDFLTSVVKQQAINLEYSQLFTLSAELARQLITNCQALILINKWSLPEDDQLNPPLEYPYESALQIRKIAQEIYPEAISQAEDYNIKYHTEGPTHTEPPTESGSQFIRLSADVSLLIDHSSYEAAFLENLG